VGGIENGLASRDRDSTNVIKLNEPPLLFLWVPFLASMLIALGHESLSRPFVNTSSEGLCNSALFLCGMALDFSLHLESLGFASIDSKGAVVLTDRAARHMLGSCHYMTNGLTTER
jgi:hypothetical protein